MGGKRLNKYEKEYLTEQKKELVDILDDVILHFEQEKYAKAVNSLDLAKRHVQNTALSREEHRD